MMSYLSGTGINSWLYTSGAPSPAQAGHVPSGPVAWQPQAVAAQGQGFAAGYVALGVLAGLVLLYVSTRGVQGMKI